MLIAHVGKDLPEKVYGVFKNDEASAAWVAGAPVCLQADGTDDGFAAVSAAITAAKSTMTVGLADTTTAAGSVGLVQIYGVRTDAVINKAGTASNANGAIGDVLIQWTASDALSGVAAGAVSGYLPSFVLMETVASTSPIATTTGTVFIRCM